MKKLAVISPRYGIEVNDESELYTRLIAQKLIERYDVEVLTTCAIDNMTWSNYYDEGKQIVNGVHVRRFKVKKQRRKKDFDLLTAEVLDDSIRTEELEYKWIEKQGPYCPEIVHYMKKNAAQYDVFIFVTCLYYLTAMGLPEVADKSILIPIIQDESFLKFKPYKKLLEAPKGYIFLTDEEEQLIHDRFDTKEIFSRQATVGIDIPENVAGNVFANKYKIDYPYVIYVGTIDEKRKCDIMFQYFLKYVKKYSNSRLKLLLIGKACIDIPQHDNIIHLESVSEEDKYSGIVGSEFLLLPPRQENLTIPILEAMALGKAILINGQCQILRRHCIRSNAGLYYENYYEFECGVHYLTAYVDARKKMETNAKEYVKDNYDWDSEIGKLSEVIEHVTESAHLDHIKSDTAQIPNRSLRMRKCTHKKIGFVTPWFGMDIQGGAESELRELVLQLKSTTLEYEVLTTCVKAFNTNWGLNYHKEGVTFEKGVLVRRFKVDKRNPILFDMVKTKLLDEGKLRRFEQKILMAGMLNSKALYRYMKEHEEEYALFVFIPYMFGTTYHGVKLNPEKAVLIPCFHDESYFHMDIFKELYSQVAGIIYNAKPERELTEKCYSVENVRQIVMGIGMDTDISGDAGNFREKYGIDEPFILYAGRKDAGKNVDTLIRYYCEYRNRNQAVLKLVLIGGGKIDIPVAFRSDIIDLGFLPIQDKYDAYAAAEFLCQPSHNESFSLVIMESWLCGRPVLVSADCAVTRNFAIESNGGLYFGDYGEFEGCVSYLLGHPKEAAQMTINGKEYVIKHFSWDVIIQKYMDFFRQFL